MIRTCLGFALGIFRAWVYLGLVWFLFGACLGYKWGMMRGRLCYEGMFKFAVCLQFVKGIFLVVWEFRLSLGFPSGFFCSFGLARGVFGVS